jgi:hypothetical protein
MPVSGAKAEFSGSLATANFGESLFHAVSIMESGCGRRLGAA